LTCVSTKEICCIFKTSDKTVFVDVRFDGATVLLTLVQSVDLYGLSEAKEVSLEQKEDVSFTVTPQYYVPYAETVLRKTTLDLKIIQALREAMNGDEKRLRSLVTDKTAVSEDLFASCHYKLDLESNGVDWQKVYGSVLKESEIVKYSEYRTQRLVLEAWDRME